MVLKLNGVEILAVITLLRRLMMVVAVDSSQLRHLDKVKAI